MAEEFDVYIRSFQQTGDETPELGLVRLFRLHPLRAVEFVQSVPRTVKRRLPREHAERYASALRELGAEIELRPSAIVPQRIMSVTGAALPELPKDPNESGRTLTLPPPAPAAVGGRPGSARVSLTSRTIVMAAPAGGFVASEPPPAQPEVLDSSATQPGFVLPVSLRPSAVPSFAPPIAPPSPPSSATWADLDRAPAIAQPQATSLQAPAPHASNPPPWSPPSLSEPPPPEDEAPMPKLPSLRPQPSSDVGLELTVDRRPNWIVDDSQFRASVNELHSAGTPAPEPSLRPSRAADASLELDDTPLHAQRISMRPERPVRPSLEHGPRTSRIVAQAVPVTRSGPAPRNLRRFVPHEFDLMVRGVFQLLVAGLVFSAVASARACVGRKAVSSAWAGPMPGAAPTSAAASEASAKPPSAGDKEGVLWCESELHQFSNGDKDVVRALIQQVTRAGASVEVADLSHSGVVTIAGELHVELPADLAKRRAIYEMLRAFRIAIWHMDPGESRASDPFEGKAMITVELS